MSRSVIYTDQRAPEGRTIRYHIDMPTPEAAGLVELHLEAGTFVPIPNDRDDGEPIFVNPERVASITPMKED